MRTTPPAIQTHCRQWTVQLPDTDFRYHRRAKDPYSHSIVAGGLLLTS